jgi:hypothetical protein
MPDKMEYMKNIEDPDDDKLFSEEVGIVAQRAGMKKSSKRNSVQIALDRSEVAELYLRGYDYVEIAERLNKTRQYQLSPANIANDISKIHERWQKSYLSDYDKLKARELARIDTLERAYWQAWEKSKEKKEKLRTLKIDDSMADKRGTKRPTFSRLKAEKEEENRDGDPKFLEGIQWCIQQRCKIMGFNAPQRIAVSDWRKEAEKAGVNAGEVFNELVGRFVRASVDGEDGGGSVEGSSETHFGE